MESYLWIKAAHLIAWFAWIGALVGLANMLAAHRKLGDSTVKELVPLERRMGVVADIGLVFTLAIGIALILKNKNFAPGDAWIMKKGWMHAKLTGVLALIGMHVYLRIAVGKARRGDHTGISRLPFGLVLLLFAFTAVMIVAQPFGRG